MGRFSDRGPVNVHAYSRDEPKSWYGRKKDMDSRRSQERRNVMLVEEMG